MRVIFSMLEWPVHAVVSAIFQCQHYLPDQLIPDPVEYTDKPCVIKLYLPSRMDVT